MAVTLESLEIHDCYVSDNNIGYGIYVAEGYDAPNVNVSECQITNCNVGIYDNDETVNVTGCVIQGTASYNSYCSTGIWAYEDAEVTVLSTEIYDCIDVPDVPPGGSQYGPEDAAGWGIFVDDYASVTCTDCVDIHGNFGGIGVGMDGSLTANGNNIHDNEYWGVYWYRYPPNPTEGPAVFEPETLDCENNWWGDEEGPTYDEAAFAADPGVSVLPIKGDFVTFGIDYTPWLDGPCPNGDPVGMSAKFKGVARSGDPGLKVIFTDLSTPPPGCDD